MKNKKIVITFKNGKIYAAGNCDSYHVWLASQKLRNREAELTKRLKLKQIFKRFIRACKYAFGKTNFEGKRFMLNAGGKK